MKDFEGVDDLKNMWDEMDRERKKENTRLFTLKQKFKTKRSD